MKCKSVQIKKKNVVDTYDIFALLIISAILMLSRVELHIFIHINLDMTLTALSQLESTCIH